MADERTGAIGKSLAEIYGEKDEGGLLCCTFETVNSDGMDVSIQVMAETINLSPYPFAEDPLTRLELSGAMDSLAHVELDLVDWDANAFATVGTSGNDPADVALLIDRVFVKLLGCAPDYTLTASMDDLA